MIARYGESAVKMTAYNETQVSKRIGVAKGKLKSPDDLDRDNEEIAKLFGCTNLSNDTCITPV